MLENRATNLLIVLREIYQDNGFMFHAFEINNCGAYLYYNGEKYGPLRGITCSEEKVKEEIIELIRNLM